MCFLALLPTYSQKCFLCLKNSKANSTSVNTKNAIQQAGQGGANTPVVGGRTPPKASGKGQGFACITQGVFLHYLTRLHESRVPGHASAHALPAKTRRDHWLTVHLTAVESKRKARLRGHTPGCTGAVRLPPPRVGPGSRQGCEAGTEVLTGPVQSACQALGRSQPSANGGDDCQVPSSPPGTSEHAGPTPETRAVTRFLRIRRRMGSSRGGHPQPCPGLGLKWTLLAAQFEGEKHSHEGLGFRNPTCLLPLPLQQTSTPHPSLF